MLSQPHIIFIILTRTCFLCTFTHLQGLSSDVVGGSSMFSGEEELFAFARCCSRLVQMGSKEWAVTAGLQ